MAGTLVLEAIVVLLVLPVVAAVGGGLDAFSGSYIVVLAVLMFLGAGGVQGRSWAIPFNLGGLQVLTLLGFFIDPALGGRGRAVLGGLGVPALPAQGHQGTGGAGGSAPGPARLNLYAVRRD